MRRALSVFAALATAAIGCSSVAPNGDVGAADVPAADVGPPPDVGPDVELTGPRGADSCPGAVDESGFALGGRCLPNHHPPAAVVCPPNWSSDAGGCRPPALPSECDGAGFPILGRGCVTAVSCADRSDDEIRERVGERFAGVVHRVAPGTLADTLVTAEAGDIVVLEAGEYTGEFDVSGVAAVGRCPGETIVRNPMASTATGALNVTRGRSSIYDLTVTGDAIGIFIAGEADVMVANVEVASARRLAIRVAGEAVAEIAHVWVHDMLPSAADDSFGRGIQVGRESAAQLRDVTIQRVRDIGLAAIDEGASIGLENVAIQSVTPNENPVAPGTGVQAFAGGASISGSRLAIWEVDSGALIASSGTVSIDGLFIHSVEMPDGFETEVRGALRSVGGATLDVTDAIVINVDGPALEVDGGVASVTRVWLDGVAGPVVHGDAVGDAVIADLGGTAGALTVLSNGCAVSVSSSQLELTGAAAFSNDTASELTLTNVELVGRVGAGRVVGASLQATDTTVQGRGTLEVDGPLDLERAALVVAEGPLGASRGPATLRDVMLASTTRVGLVSVGELEGERLFVVGTLEVAGGDAVISDSVISADDVAALITGGRLEVSRVELPESRRAVVESGQLDDPEALFELTD